MAAPPKPSAKSSTKPLVVRSDPSLAAELAGLRYVNPDERGYLRRRRGRGFAYYDKKNQLIQNPRIKARISKLAIPPAWTKVWICANARGHVQATGYDERGRKQYIYHADWVAIRDRAKFSAMPAFGQALPSIRRRVAEDLERDEFVLEKAVAIVIRFMDDTLIRVGNQRYTRGRLQVGVDVVRLDPPPPAFLVEVLEQVIAGDLDALLRERGELGVLDAQVDVLAALADELQTDLALLDLDVALAQRGQAKGRIADAPFTAKDFRTWSASTSAAELLWETGGEAESVRARKAVVTAMVASVAEQLHNTPAVCRGSYIHPQIIDSYMDGRFVAHYERAVARAVARPIEHLDTAEAALLELLPAIRVS